MLKHQLALKELFNGTVYTAKVKAVYVQWYLWYRCIHCLKWLFWGRVSSSLLHSLRFSKRTTATGRVRRSEVLKQSCSNRLVCNYIQLHLFFPFVLNFLFRPLLPVTVGLLPSRSHLPACRDRPGSRNGPHVCNKITCSFAQT